MIGLLAISAITDAGPVASHPLLSSFFALSHIIVIHRRR